MNFVTYSYGNTSTVKMENVSINPKSVFMSMEVNVLSLFPSPTPRVI